MIDTPPKLTEMQLELLKSFSHITDEKQLKEAKSLLNFYFRKKLEETIDTSERSKHFVSATYEEWLRPLKK